MQIDESSMAAPAQQARTRNFTAEEDLLLCKAYINVSQDPIKGNDQKANTFWDAVTASFKSMLKKYSARASDPRLQQSLWNRFKRRIQKDVIAFNAIRKSLQVQSGESDEDFTNRAKVRFSEKYHGRAFQFFHCLEVLSAMPVFSIEDTEIIESSEVAANNSVYSFTKQDRPQGNKAAKNEAKQALIKENYQAKKIKVLHGLNAAMEKVAASSKMLATSVKEANDKDYFVNLARLYKDMGDDGAAKEAVEALKALAPKPKSEVAVASSGDPIPSAIEVGGGDSGGVDDGDDESATSYDL